MTHEFADEPAEVTLTQDQALVAVGFAAVSSDGQIGADEVTAVARALSGLGVLGSDQARDDLLHDVVRLAHTHRVGPLTRTALATLAGDRREAALRLAFAVLVVDGNIPDDELAFARGLQQALEISDERYDQLAAAVA